MQSLSEICVKCSSVIYERGGNRAAMLNTGDVEHWNKGRLHCGGQEEEDEEAPERLEGAWVVSGSWQSLSLFAILNFDCSVINDLWTLGYHNQLHHTHMVAINLAYSRRGCCSGVDRPLSSDEG